MGKNGKTGEITKNELKNNMKKVSTNAQKCAFVENLKNAQKNALCTPSPSLKLLQSQHLKSSTIETGGHGRRLERGTTHDKDGNTTERGGWFLELQSTRQHKSMLFRRPEIRQNQEHFQR